MVDFKIQKSVAKHRFTSIDVDLDMLVNIYKLKEILLAGLDSKTNYSMLVRISHLNPESQYADYKMLGSQLGVYIEDKSKCDDVINSIQDLILSRILLIIEEYNIKISAIITIQLLLYNTRSDIRLIPIKPKSTDFQEQKDLINFSDYIKNYEFSNLINNPVDMGVLLKKNIFHSKLYSVYLKQGLLIKVSEFFAKDFHKFDENTLFYQKRVKNQEYILVVCNRYRLKIIFVYTLTGLLISQFFYTFFDDNQNHYSRRSGNVTTYIKNGDIYKKDINIKFPLVYTYNSNRKSDSLTQPNWKIGSFDLETYKEGDISKAYAVGFYTKDSMNTYYLNSDLDSESLILKCIDNMLKSKYNNYTFYCHNFKNFDVYFIFYLLIGNDNKYKCVPYFREDKIIALKISSLFTDKVYSIKLVDSCNFFSESLGDLCKSFSISITKGYFPYKFVNKNTIFYKGIKPDYSYYKQIDPKRQISLTEYNNISPFNWDLKKETLSYLELDLICLFNIMEKFITRVYINYNIQVTNSLTISSLAMDIFLRKYHNGNIPLVKVQSVYNDIKKSYYGGVSEVYKPFGVNLYYYDVNSLYPFSALNVMPGRNCVYTDNINENINKLDNIFGFYFCRIKAPDNYLGLLPVKSDEGLTMPTGEYEGWYFSEEIKFAAENGYDITVVKGYSFDRVYNVFYSYVKDLYKIKSNTKDSVERQMVKSLLNNLLGRFGLDINKYITSLVTEEEFNNIIQTRKVRGIKFIGKKILLSYEKNINKNVCLNHNLDFKNIVKDRTKDISTINEDDYHDVSVVISSCITSYARIFMSKVKLDILQKGGLIYYTDTDSIITNIKLPEDLIGKDIGQFKLEHEISEGYFISNKTYGFKTKSGDVIIKSKGLYKGELTYSKLKELYLGKPVEGIRYETIKSLSKGSASLYHDNKIILSPDSYNKRIKIMDQNSIWVDTRPIKKYHTLTTTNNKKSTIHNIYFYLYIILLLLLCLIPLSYYYWLDSLLIINLEHTINNITDTLNSTLNDIPNKFSKEPYINNNFDNKLNSSKSYKFIRSDMFNNIKNSTNIHKTISKTILDEVLNLHFKQDLKDNLYLKNKISGLEIELEKYKLYKIQSNIHLNNLIKDVNKYLKDM